MQNNNTKVKKKNNTTRFQIFYFFGYAAMGVMNPLISQYLGDIGFSGTQIGTVTSVATAIAVFASAFWGKRYSNSRDGRRVIALICAAAAVMALANTTVTAFALFVVTYGIQYFFQGPVMGVADALVFVRSDELFVCPSLGCCWLCRRRIYRRKSRRLYGAG